MLDVERRPDVDARLEQLLDILPAFGVTAVWRVGVREFIDHDEPWLARERGVEIEFLNHAPLMGDASTGQDLQPFR